MNKRSDDLADVIRSEAAALGATVVTTGTSGSSHKFAVIDLCGKQRKVFYSRSPNARRAPLHIANDVRRIIRGMCE
jgi:hypothetical protein